MHLRRTAVDDEGLCTLLPSRHRYRHTGLPTVARRGCPGSGRYARPGQYFARKGGDRFHGLASARLGTEIAATSGSDANVDFRADARRPASYSNRRKSGSSENRLAFQTAAPDCCHEPWSDARIVRPRQRLRRGAAPRPPPARPPPPPPPGFFERLFRRLFPKFPVPLHVDPLERRGVRHGARRPDRPRPIPRALRLPGRDDEPRPRLRRRLQRRPHRAGGRPRRLPRIGLPGAEASGLHRIPAPPS